MGTTRIPIHSKLSLRTNVIKQPSKLPATTHITQSQNGSRNKTRKQLNCLRHIQPVRFSPPAYTKPPAIQNRSEEHTSELQSLRHLVCRLLLEKKKEKRQSRDQLSTTRIPDTSRHTCCKS